MTHLNSGYPSIFTAFESSKAFPRKNSTIVQLNGPFYGRVERGSQNIALRTLCIVAQGLGVHPIKLLCNVTEEDIKDLTPPGY